MIWLTAISIPAILAAIASIWATAVDRRDIGTGSPSFETLVSHTGVWKREVFVELLGEPDTEDRFELPPDKLRELARSVWVIFLDNMFSDAVSITLSGAAPVLWFYNTSLAIASLAVGAGMQMAGYGIATLVTYRAGLWHKWVYEEHETRNGTGDEPTHPPQPAAGPAASGKSSPPAQ